MPTTTKGLISRADLVRGLGVSSNTVARWVHQGVAGQRLVPVAVGGKIYFEPEEVERFQRAVGKARGFGEPAATGAKAKQQDVRSRRERLAAAERVLERHGYKIGEGEKK